MKRADIEERGEAFLGRQVEVEAARMADAETLIEPGAFEVGAAREALLVRLLDQRRLAIFVPAQERSDVLHDFKFIRQGRLRWLW